MQIDDTPSPADIDFLEEEIYRYNVASTNIEDGRLLSVLVRDGQSTVAGLYGHTWGGVLEIRSLWVQDTLRGQGYGTRLLGAAEAEALRRGCFMAVLDTHSFQAPRFYQKCGYEIYAVLPDYPRGHSKIYLKKQLLVDPKE